MASFTLNQEGTQSIIDYYLLKASSILSFTVIIILLFSLPLLRTRNIHNVIAKSGNSPIDYVYQATNPENYTKGFDNNFVPKYSNSIGPKIFLFLYQNFNIIPETALRPYASFQLFLLLIALSVFTQTVFCDIRLTALFLLIACFSGFAGIDLSRFGKGYATNYPLYATYNYAHAFCLFSLTLLIRRHYILFAVPLSIASLFHITVGLFYGLFIVGFFIYQNGLLKKNTILATLIIIPSLIPGIIAQLTNSNFNIMPLGEWIGATKAFGFHWYPIGMRQFTLRGHTHFLPLVLLFLSYLLIGHRYAADKDLNRLILWGCITSIIATLAGIVFSEYYPSRTLISLSLPRITGWLSFFCTFLFSACVYRQFEEGNYPGMLIGGFACFIFLTHGIPFALLILLTGINIYYSQHNSTVNTISNSNVSFTSLIKLSKVLFWLGLAFVISWGAYQYLLCGLAKGELPSPIDFWKPLSYFNIWCGQDFFFWGWDKAVPKWASSLLIIISLSGFSLLIIIHRLWLNRLRSLFVFVLSLLMLAGSIYFLPKNPLEFSLSPPTYYMKAQLWARDNTKPGSLFFVWPTICYGWRDYSHRPSLGCYRDWGYTCINYIPDKDAFEKGKTLLEEFGVNPNVLTQYFLSTTDATPLTKYFRTTIKESLKHYSIKQLISLIARYDIDYIVVPTREAPSAWLEVFLTEYSNKEYLILNTKRGNLSSKSR